MSGWLLLAGAALVFFLWPSSEKWVLPRDIIAITADRKETVSIPKGAEIEITKTDEDGTVHFVWKGASYVTAQEELREPFEP